MRELGLRGNGDCGVLHNHSLHWTGANNGPCISIAGRRPRPVNDGPLSGMANVACPICASPMSEGTVAPCFDCGHAESELRELAAGEHEYHRYRIFGHEIVLCDFCDADFGSYYPGHFGLPGETPGEVHYDLELVSRVENPKTTKDWVCEKCNHRLAFLSFLAEARRANAG